MKLTYECLESVHKYTDDCEVIVIDNKPTKETENFRELADIYVANEVNNGNGAAWNQGAALAHGEYICLMDNDVKVTKSWSKDLIKILKDKKVAVAFPLSKNKEDDDYFERLAGFCWIIRRDLFNKLGRIDESYGIANFEDTDFFMRAKSKGYLLKCSVKSKVDHYSRATTSKVKEVDELYPKNEKKYFDKYKVLPMLD